MHHHILRTLEDKWDVSDDPDARWATIVPSVLAGVTLIAVLLLALTLMLGFLA